MTTPPQHKIALITGASSGFGYAICHRLLKEGYHVIAAARRVERLAPLRVLFGARVCVAELDVRHAESVAKLHASLPEEFRAITLLINNAGLALGLERAHEANFDDWQTMIDTNVMGLTRVTHCFLPGMVERGQGHIINIGSVAGTYPYPGGNVYGATKAFVAQFSLNLRADLAGTGLRVTEVRPGLCSGTEFSNVRFKGDTQKVDSVYAGVQALTPEDIAETISWIAAQPPHFNVNAIELMPTAQSFSPLHVSRTPSASAQ
jgi:3-hydroxy acid dehydrogenase/malonic semialdehyde reductase